MRRLRKIQMMLLTVFWAMPAHGLVQESDRGRQLVEELDRRGRGYGDFRATLEMSVRSRDDRERVRSMTIRGFESERSDHTLITLSRPADLAGTTFLSVVDRDGSRAQWIYLPSSRRTRRIGGGESNDSFLGSHFSYSDLSAQPLEGFEYRWIRDQEIEGGPGALVERCAQSCVGRGSRQLLWIGTTRHLIHRVDFFDEVESRVKTLHIRSYKEVDGFWRPERMEMVDLASGGSTTLVWSEIAIGVGLRERDFDPQRLGRNR
jgi:Outer membrane lipoprotein-sorting protein